MKPSLLLAITSVLSVVLFSIHVADDMARGLDTVGLHNIFAVVIYGTWLYGALILSGRRSGLVIQLLGAIVGLLVLGVHLQGAGIQRIARAPSGFSFLWTLFALGTTSLLALVLSVSEWWSLRRRGR